VWIVTSVFSKGYSGGWNGELEGCVYCYGEWVIVVTV